jgi:hypothetical protein
MIFDVITGTVTMIPHSNALFAEDEGTTPAFPETGSVRNPGE